MKGERKNVLYAFCSTKNVAYNKKIKVVTYSCIIINVSFFPFFISKALSTIKFPNEWNI